MDQGHGSLQQGQHGHCPWCGADSLGFWEKLTLGPLMPRKCGNCAHYVRASWPSTLGAIAIVLVPFTAAMAYGETANLGGLASLLVAGAGLAIGGAAAGAWHRTHLRLLPHAGPSPQG